MCNIHRNDPQPAGRPEVLPAAQDGDVITRRFALALAGLVVLFLTLDLVLGGLF